MARPDTHVRFQHCCEYALARAAAGVLRGVPFRLAVACGRAIGVAFYSLDRRHRQRVEDQLRRAFRTEMTEATCRQTARAMYLHLGTMLAEFVRHHRLTLATVDAIVDWQGQDACIRDILAQGKGAIYATGHIGNWEFNGAAFCLKGLSAGAIARPLDNPLLDRYVKETREACGQAIWDKFGALRHVVRILRQGRGFGILVDQDAGRRGVFAPFFGQTASTMPTPADLALRTGAPIVVCAFHRTQSPMRFRFTMRPPLWADARAEQGAERLRLLSAMNAHLEDIIRESPAQWLWLHKRWKTRPMTEAKRIGA